MSRGGISRQVRREVRPWAEARAPRVTPFSASCWPEQELVFEKSTREADNRNEGKPGRQAPGR